jgi:hypothetical protein
VRRYRRNPDERERELERQAAAGDAEAGQRLLVALRRKGPLPIKMEAMENYLQVFPGQTFVEIAEFTGTRRPTVALVLKALDAAELAWSDLYITWRTDWLPRVGGPSADWKGYGAWQRKASREARWYPRPIPKDYPYPNRKRDYSWNPDERTRDLERLAVSGSDEDRFRWWIEQLRAGDEVNAGNVYLSWLVNTWAFEDVRRDEEEGGYTPSPQELGSRYSERLGDRALAVLKDSVVGFANPRLNNQIEYFGGETTFVSSRWFTFDLVDNMRGLAVIASDLLRSRGFSAEPRDTVVLLRDPTIEMNAMGSVNTYIPYIRFLRYLGGASVRSCSWD